MRRAAALLIALVLPALVGAQQPMGESFPLARVPAVIREVVPRPTVVDARAMEPTTEVTMMPAMRIRAVPGNLAVVRIPVPTAFRTADGRQSAVSYRVTTGSSVRLVSSESGTIDPTDSALRMTLNLLRSASPGRDVVARVHFTDAGGRAVEMPLEIDVPTQRNLQLNIVDAFIGGARGNWTAVNYEIRNAGNGTERVSVTAVLPQGWRSASDDMRGEFSLAARETRRSVLRLWIPPNFASGQASVRLALSAAGAVVASAEMRVNVQENGAGHLAGPQLAVSALGALTPDGNVVSGYLMNVNGAIADSVFVTARVGVASGGGDVAAGYALARSGAIGGPPTVSVTSRHMDVNAGALGLQQSELGGFFVAGLGAASRVRSGAYGAALFASRPFGSIQQNALATQPGRHTGAELSRHDSWGTTRLQGVSLREPSFGRSLDALTLQADVAHLAGGVLSSEIGYRSFAGGTGTGIASSYRLATDATQLDVRVMHAPGGSRAFARATDDVAGTVSQRLPGGATVSGGGWLQRDNNFALGQLANTGWFVNPSLDLRRLHSTVGVEVRGNSFESSNAASRFVNGEQQVAGLLDVHYKAAYTSLRVGYGTLARRFSLQNASIPEASGERLDTRVSSGVHTGAGSFELLYMSQQFSGPIGLFPAMQSLALRADRVRLPMPAHLPVYLNGDAQRFLTGAFAGRNLSARGGLTATLPADLGGLTFQAEYNPFVMAASGNRNGLFYTLRLDKTFGLPRFGPSRDQRLFVDVNGNGVADRGERGVARAVIECGALVVVTDGDGRFACPAGTPVQVDARTMPIGLLAPSSRPASAPRGDIAVRPVQSQIVRLLVSPADSMRVRTSDLRQILVIARDSAGTAWVARPLQHGEFSFDALPPGTYTIDIDASAIAEPLRPATTPSLIVRDGATGAPLEIELKTRDIRIKQLGTRGNSAPRTTGQTEGATRTNQKTNQ